MSDHVSDSMAWSGTGTGTGTGTDIGMTERAQRSNISTQGTSQHRSATLRRYTTVTVTYCSFEFHRRDWGGDCTEFQDQSKAPATWVKGHNDHHL